MDYGQLESLVAMARAVAQDHSLTVEVGEPGCGFSLLLSEGRIQADPLELESTPHQQLLGLMCHEAAHAALTRYPDIIPPGQLGALGMASLANALEDCRIESWLADRFPGAQRWIDDYNERMLSLDGVHSGLPYFQQYCMGAIAHWWHGALPPDLTPIVSDALTATAVAREKFTALRPPTQAVDPQSIARYRASRVRLAYQTADPASPPDALECEVRCLAWQSWCVLWHEIWPTYETLLRADPRTTEMLRAAEQNLQTTLRAVQPGTGAQRSKRRRALPIGSLPPAMRAESQRIVEGSSPSIYDKAHGAVHHLTQPMVRRLGEVLRRRAVPTKRNGFRTGTSVSLRHAMQAEHDPTRARPWQRKVAHAKRSAAFTLLLDLSGSMHGEPIEQGFRAVVLLASVLDQLCIPFAIAGFQDELLRFKSHAEPLDLSTKQLLGRMPLEVLGTRPDGNNRPDENWDGPALLEAARELQGVSATDHLLLVVSDGQPSGPGDGAAALRTAIAQISAGPVQLVGIGLGTSGRYVKRYYARHTVVDTLEDLPAAVACILERHVAGAP